LKCNLCGSDNNTVALSKRGYNVLRCNDCGFKFSNCMPSREDLDEIYGKGYFTNYNQNKYGYEDYNKHKHLYIDLFVRKIEEIEKMKSRGSLLDVGCATGVMLDVARLRGWDVRGVDLSAYASGIAREYYNLDVFTGTLHEAAFDDRSFDVVFMYDVIEHLTDPRSLLEEAARVLKDDGLLVINTPNVEGFLAKLLHSKWFHYKLQTHLAYFSPETLGTMLDSVGMEQICTSVSGRVVNMEYIVGRLSYDLPWLAKIMKVFFNGGAFSKNTFSFYSGEFQSFAVKKRGGK